VARQYQLYNEALIPAFHTHGIRIVSHGERNAASAAGCMNTFCARCNPLLVPVGLDPAHPFPMVANKSLNFIVRLDGVGRLWPQQRDGHRAVPRALPRLIRMPQKIGGQGSGCSSALQRHPRAPGRFVSRAAR
jgi:polyphosphate kinase